MTENLSVEKFAQKPFARFGFIDWRKLARFAREVVDRYSITPKNPAVVVKKLSGGNRQKVVVGRVFSRSPSVLIAGQPTRGLDLNATYFIRQQLLEQRDNGAGVFLVSADLDEVLELSDRIAVMFNGKFVSVLDRETASRELVGRLMLGVN